MKINRFSNKWFCKKCGLAFKVPKEDSHSVKCCPFCKEERELKYVKYENQQTK